MTRRSASGRLAGPARRRLSRLTVAATLEPLAGSDLVIEAVFEDMAVKQELFGSAVSLLWAGRVIATNTSYLDVERDGRGAADRRGSWACTSSRRRNVMKLLEIVRARRASPRDAGDRPGRRQGARQGQRGRRRLRRVHRQSHSRPLPEGVRRHAGGGRVAEGDRRRASRLRLRDGTVAVRTCRASTSRGRGASAMLPLRKPSDRYEPGGGQAVRDGPLRPEDGRGVVPLRERASASSIRWSRRSCARTQRSTGRPQRSFRPDEIVSRVLA